MAKEYGHWTVDFNFPVADALYRAYSADPANSAKIIGDRIHPGYPGHLVMAAALLKAWHAPALRNEVGIDAPSGAVVAKGAKVSDVKRGDTVEWTQLDEFLPFPIDRKDPLTALTVSSAPVVDELFSGQIMRVTGLTGANYALTIDGEAVGTFSAAALGSGVDLAKLDTPMAKQAAEVHVLTNRRAGLKYNLWRQIEVGLQKLPSRERDDVIASYGRLEDDLIRRQHAMAKPKPRRFVLTPVG
jgi:hypothetical protein